MTDTPDKGPDYSKTLFLPQTDFPMRAGLPQKEPQILARWKDIGLYGKLRAAGQGRPKFVLHDGPPYANGNIHIGHALNKILKDMVTRSQQMLGKDSNYVPGWDCHGLPIEWKIEEDNYRSKGKPKPDFAHAQAMIAFRQECRAYAEHWVNVQREEFKRLGVEGDWDNPYLTMAYAAEAQIAREIMKFAANGLLYRGSKPVMWSVVEKTALAEAEVEYEDHTSDTVWVAFPVKSVSKAARAALQAAAQQSGESPDDIAAADDTLDDLKSASVVIWTTTPLDAAGQPRHFSYSHKIDYGLYRVTNERAPGQLGERRAILYVLADRLASDVFKSGASSNSSACAASILPISSPVRIHPLASSATASTSPCSTATMSPMTPARASSTPRPVMAARISTSGWPSGRMLAQRGIDTRIPYHGRCRQRSTQRMHPVLKASVSSPKRAIRAMPTRPSSRRLIEAGNIIARGRLKHQYPHSWRSKKPVIFRNTPQWFIAMDKGFDAESLLPASGEKVAEGRMRGGESQSATTQPLTPALSPQAGRGSNAPTLRDLALTAITQTRWVPAAGENRITGMIGNKPGLGHSRQRAWGVPIAVFVKKGTHDILVDEAVNARIADAFAGRGRRRLVRRRRSRSASSALRA